jgi:hypothetical protein
MCGTRHMPPGPSDLNSGAACHCCCPTIRVGGPIAKTGCPGLDFQTWKLDDSHPQLPTNLVILGESRHSARSRSTCSCPPATDLDYVGSSGFQAAEIIRRKQQGFWARTLHPVKTFGVLRMAQRAMNNCGGPSRALQPQKYSLSVRRSFAGNSIVRVFTPCDSRGIRFCFWRGFQRRKRMPRLAGLEQT